MKKQLIYLIIFISCLFLIGCQSVTNHDNEGTSNQENTDERTDEESEGHDMGEIDVFDFENIGRAPDATEEHPINEVIKIYFSQWTFDDPYEPIAINVADNEIYVNPSLSLQRFSTYDDVVQISNANDVVDILEKYEVQEWERDYTFEDPDTYEDGYSWRLWLQFEDGSVEKHSGKGTDVDKLTPENFHAFAKELTEFVERNLEEGNIN